METTTFNVTPTALGDLPNELFPVIVNGDVEVHHGLAHKTEKWWIDGYAGPTVRSTDKTGKWWIDGYAGPIVRSTDKTGKWWIDGYTEPTVCELHAQLLALNAGVVLPPRKPYEF